MSGMFGGSGSKTTGTSTTTANMTKDVKYALEDTIKDGRSLYNNSQLFQPYTGSTVVPYSPETQQSWAGIKAAGTAAQPSLNAAYQGIGQIANGSGLTNTQNGAITQLQGIANGKNAINTGGLYSAIGNAANGSYSESNLKNYANGSQIGVSNPAFQKVLQRTQNDAQGAVERSASAAGRYGSGIAQGNVAREVGDVTASALANQYNQDVSNQFSANSLLDAQRSGNLTTRLNAAAGLTGVQGQNIANQASAAGDVFNAGQQGQTNRFTAAGMLPTLYDATLDPSRALAGIGTQKEDLATRQMNDKLRLFQEKQDQPRNAIEWLTQLAQGQAKSAGSKTTAAKPGTNPFLAGAAGALSGFNNSGTLGGSIGGALVGGLGSLF